MFLSRFMKSSQDMLMVVRGRHRGSLFGFYFISIDKKRNLHFAFVHFFVHIENLFSLVRTRGITFNRLIDSDWYFKKSISHNYNCLSFIKIAKVQNFGFTWGLLRPCSITDRQRKNKIGVAMRIE